jgi:hypothetical protein
MSDTDALAAKVAVWWLQPTALRQLVSDADDTVDIWRLVGVPAYIGSELRSAMGRSGNGRLWIPSDIGISRIAWDSKHTNAPYCSKAAGIVLWRHDVPRLAGLPGLVTDYWMDSFW